MANAICARIPAQIDIKGLFVLNFFIALNDNIVIWVKIQEILILSNYFLRWKNLEIEHLIICQIITKTAQINQSNIIFSHKVNANKLD